MGWVQTLKTLKGCWGYLEMAQRVDAFRYLTRVVSIILFDHASPYFSWGWITACEEVCCGMLKMKEPLKSNRHCTALSSLVDIVDTNSLRAGPIVEKGSLKCMAK